MGSTFIAKALVADQPNPLGNGPLLLCRIGILRWNSLIDSNFTMDGPIKNLDIKTQHRMHGYTEKAQLIICNAQLNNVEFHDGWADGMGTDA